MPKSESARQMDEVQTGVAGFLKEAGFRGRARTFTRRTEDGLTQVIEFQMGRFHPPGTYTIPGFKDDLYGQFTVNLGVFAPEVQQYWGNGTPPKQVRESDCFVRVRLGELGPEKKDLWWPAQAEAPVIADLRVRLERDALPFLDRFASRDLVLREWGEVSENPFSGPPTRIVCAILLAGRGLTEKAESLLSVEVRTAEKGGYKDLVRDLARKLGLGPISTPA